MSRRMSMVDSTLSHGHANDMLVSRQLIVISIKYSLQSACNVCEFTCKSALRKLMISGKISHWCAAYVYSHSTPSATDLSCWASESKCKDSAWFWGGNVKFYVIMITPTISVYPVCHYFAILLSIVLVVASIDGHLPFLAACHCR